MLIVLSNGCAVRAHEINFIGIEGGGPKNNPRPHLVIHCDNFKEEDGECIRLYYDSCAAVMEARDRLVYDVNRLLSQK